MNFSLEIGPQSDLESLPPVKDIYVTCKEMTEMVIK